MSLRENNKHHLYLIIYQIKRVIDELCTRLSYHDGLSSQEESYFLTIDEIKDALLSNKNFDKNIIGIRKRAFCEDNKNAGDFDKLSGNSGKELKSLTACSGIATGKARVLNSFDDMDIIENGDILVVKAIDIWWTPVFSKISALVTEIGGTLSPAAIIAREFGL